MRDSPYPDQARYVSRVCAQLGLTFSDLDYGRGYLFSVTDGSSTLVTGAGQICTYPLNSAAAFGISVDKAHTNTVLSRSGIPVIPSRLYFITETHAKLRPSDQAMSDALAAVSTTALPVFCKPNSGSRGDFAELIYSVPQFREYLDRVRCRYNTILIQPVISGTEYRIFCVNDTPVFYAKKAEFCLTGDGAANLGALIREQNERLFGYGISLMNLSSMMEYLIAEHNYSSEFIPALGQKIVLPGRRNLSAGTEVAAFSTEVPTALARLAGRAMAAVGLRVSGVDIFDVSPGNDLSDLVVIEVNGNPSISSLSRLGRDDVIDHIWRTVLTSYFSEQSCIREIRKCK